MDSVSLEKSPPYQCDMDQHVEKGEGQVTHESFKRVYSVWTASAYQVLMMASWTCNIVLYGTVFDIGGPMMLIYSTAQIIAAIVQLRYPDYIPTSWQIWLIYSAILLISVLFCLSQKHLPAISLLGAVLTFGGGIAWAVTFLVRANKHDATFVFNHLINQSGYTSTGWVGLMSFYTPVYALYGTDGILHITEEIHNPEKNAPRAMILSMIFSGITSLMGAVVMGFCSGDWESYIESEMLKLVDSLPFIPWFVEVLGSVAGASVLVVVVIVFLNFLITVGINTAASRMAWGMATDNALPFSNVFVRISPKWESPIYTILLTVAAELAIGLVVFGSNYAFQAIVSLGGVAIQIGYLTPVLMAFDKLIIRGRSALPPSQYFNLGKFGLVVNITSVCWSSLIIVILLFPLYVPVTSNNIYDMNWAIVMCGGLIILVTVDWLLRGRFHYTVPEE
ncbi:hypothetical protein N7530_012323 [Penicillium desertorum]|uniref:Uncharacterized protein n=1 Tax=Penicillium desertorum TaxID=1303715 RepID=A0A9X0BGM3_9EURO|nr:hypothetical protein N7530_012323 [Penicillium desertorum]